MVSERTGRVKRQARTPVGGTPPLVDLYWLALLDAGAPHGQNEWHGNPVDLRGREVGPNYGHHHQGDGTGAGGQLGSDHLALMVDEHGHPALFFGAPARSNPVGWRNVPFGDRRIESPGAFRYAAKSDDEGDDVMEEVVRVALEGGAEGGGGPWGVGAEGVEIAKLYVRLGVRRIDLGECLVERLRVFQVTIQAVGASKESLERGSFPARRGALPRVARSPRHTCAGPAMPPR